MHVLTPFFPSFEPAPQFSASWRRTNIYILLVRQVGDCFVAPRHEAILSGVVQDC
jgi:hypothetical protein